METMIAHAAAQKKTGFKSYYVVWKPNTTTAQKVAPKRFKSYYVVWKLDPPVSEDVDDMSFKSYYVVWKLLNHPVLQYAYRGLNRTM